MSISRHDTGTYASENAQIATGTGQSSPPTYVRRGCISCGGFLWPCNWCSPYWLTTLESEYYARETKLYVVNPRARWFDPFRSSRCTIAVQAQLAVRPTMHRVQTPLNLVQRRKHKRKQYLGRLRNA